MRTAAELARTIHAYPTYAEGPARAAEQWFAHAYLTPRTRRLLRPLLRGLTLGTAARRRAG